MPVPKIIDFGIAKATQADLTVQQLVKLYEQTNKPDQAGLWKARLSSATIH